MENEQHRSEIPKIKIIGRIQNGTYQEQFLTGDTAESDLARKLLRLFSPEDLTNALVRQYGENSVLVFRTDAAQMEEFRLLLESHGTEHL